jgi:hypothetical protein
MNGRSRPKAAPTENAFEHSTHHFRSLVVTQRQTALQLTAEGVAATTVDDILRASAEELIAYLGDRPAVFVREPMPGLDLDEQAAMERVIQVGGRVRVARVQA